MDSKQFDPDKILNTIIDIKKAKFDKEIQKMQEDHSDVSKNAELLIKYLGDNPYGTRYHFGGYSDGIRVEDGICNVHVKTLRYVEIHYGIALTMVYGASDGIVKMFEFPQNPNDIDDDL